MDAIELAKEVDTELSKVWQRRGWTRGFPLWEQKLAIAALTVLTENGITPKLREKVGDRSYHTFEPELSKLLLIDES